MGLRAKNNEGQYKEVTADSGFDNSNFLHTAEMFKSLKVLTVSGESISLSAGAALTTGKFVLAGRGTIFDANGIDVGKYGDTSFAVASGTSIVTELPYDATKSDAEIYAYLVRTYTPAYLTGGNSATSNYATWAAVTDGEFSITINGTAYDITGIDFSAATSMAEVATVIQTAIRAATSSLETVTWSTNHFVISSVDTTSSSAITVTSAVSGGSGTDISGAGATAFIDADTGHGTVTNKYNGMYAVNYVKGIVYYSKGDANTAITVNYKHYDSSVSIEPGDIEIGAVEIKNASNDDRVIVKAGNSFAVGDLAMGIADANVLSALRNDSKAYDSTNITYVSGGAADGEISTVVYKLAAATIYTLTMAYDATTGKLTTVTRS